MTLATIITAKEANKLESLIASYELSNLAGGKSRKTIVGYNDILYAYRRFVKDKNYPDTLESLTITIAREYIIYLKNRHKFLGHPCTPEQGETLSVETVRCHVRALKAFSTWLYEEQYIEENVLQKLKLPKAPQVIIEPLTKMDIDRVVACIDKKSKTGFRNYAVIITALDTGLRASEVVNLQLSDLNIGKGVMKVMGKGAKERIVPVGVFATSVLLAYIKHFREASISGKHDNLFLSNKGMPLTVNAIKLMFTRLARSSRVERLHAHLCRHTFAINYLLNGGDIFSLKEILGHSNLDMVQHYLHFTSTQITERHHKYSPMDKFYK
jgi:site-specific recombinase XerD